MSRRHSRPAQAATPVEAEPSDGKARIAAAIEAARAQQIQPATIPVSTRGLHLDPAGSLDFHTEGDGRAPQLLLLDSDRGCWIPVSCHPGDWQIVPKGGGIGKIVGLDGKPLA